MGHIYNRFGGGLDKGKITVTSANQILSGYKDFDSDGNLITGNNLGYDAGVAQGHADRDSGVTVTSASHVINGYKARTSDGSLVTGTDKGYSAGVTQGHADRDSGVTLDYDSNHLIQGYKARTSAGVLITGTNKGYDAGVTQGHSDRDTGVTVTAASHIVNGYKARNSSGTLLTGNASPLSISYISEKSGSGNSGPGVAGITFNAVVGGIYVASFGGSAGDLPNALAGSGFTQLAFHRTTYDNPAKGVFVGILKATSTSVTVKGDWIFPASGAVIVYRIA